jgi:secreted PhoX family phosphatase
MRHFQAATFMLLGTCSLALADIGTERDALLLQKAQEAFGIASPVDASADKSAVEGFRTESQKAGDQLLLAGGLQAEYVTRNVANHADMMAFFPAENPTHLIICIEGDREELEGGRLNPGVQRVALADGKVETIVRGTSACDGIRTTPWNTVLFTEEDDDGGAYELLDPLATSEIVIKDRKTGEVSDASKVAKRTALPTMAWEGLTILPSGVIFAGDELRPGTSYHNTDGGAIFKFVPAKPHAGGAITAIDQSPLAAGSVYAMQVSCTDKVQVGQGCEVGNATWIGVKASAARSTADIGGATGYYRPEDLHQDPAYRGEGVRFCWTNTGNKAIGNYGEVMCAVDTMADGVESGKQTVTVTRVIAGDPELNQPDNLEMHPSGMMYVIEDNPNGDIWSCLPDGQDRDVTSDGCLRILSVKDTSAEPTGFIFAPDGQTAYLHIQHSDDAAMPKVDGYGTDDLIRITGFGKVKLAQQ